MTLFDVIKNPIFTHKFVLQKIICHLNSWERDSLMTHYDEEISSDLYNKIEKLYKLYSVNHEPLEYIL
jgi:methylase of polypeptide subunit release factors